MKPTIVRLFTNLPPVLAQTLVSLALALVVVSMSPGSAFAADAAQGIEQLLTAAQQDKKGVTLYVGGQTIAGAVTRVEPGQWVEMRNQQSSRIIVRLDRIDGIAVP